MKTLMAIALAALLALNAPTADAKRMGSGANVGKQSSSVTQRQNAAPANTQNSTTQGNTAAQQQSTATNNRASQPAAASTAAQQPAKKPWGAMLGGLAAGLGLAWLANSLGLGEAFGNILMAILLGVAVLAIIGFIMRKRAASGATPRGAHSGNLAYVGASAQPQSVASAPQYNPARVGNDASARPWEQPTAASSIIGSDLGGAAAEPTSNKALHTPEGFDVSAFERAAHANFIALQAAWDRADIPTLRSMMTDEMLSEIRAQIDERQAQGLGPNHTEVISLQAQFLGIEDLGSEWMASVEFNGLIREEAGAAPEPMREIWNMTRVKNGASGWLVAGLQPLQ